MNADHYKKILIAIIDEMAEYPWLFANDPEHDFTRRRKLPFDALLKFLIGAGGEPLGLELFNFFKENGPDVFNFASPSAYVQQMAKLVPGTLEFVFRMFNERCGDDPVTMDGYRLVAIDGTTLSIPKDEDAESYIEVSKGRFGNQIHLNVFVDILNKTVTDCFTQPMAVNNERVVFLDMLKRNPPTSDTIYVMDRGYGSFNLFETLNRTPHAGYVVRVTNDFCKAVATLPIEEFDRDVSVEIRTTQTKEDKERRSSGNAVLLQGPSKFGKHTKHVRWFYESPFTLTMRVVRVRIGSPGSKNEYETIITSLDRFRFPLERIKEIYHMRWTAETLFRDLKYSIGLVNVHSRKEEYIMQEVYARLVAFNFASRIAACVVVRNDRGNKYEYEVDFKSAAYICMDFFRSLSMRAPPNLIKGIGRFIHPIRPGRSDERKIKPKGCVPFIYRVA